MVLGVRDAQRVVVELRIEQRRQPPDGVVQAAVARRHQRVHCIMHGDEQANVQPRQQRD